MSKTPQATYEDIAHEYYEPLRHPTCVNFRDASLQILRRWLRRAPLGHGWICEVGAGNSVLAQVLVEQDAPLGRLLISDVSAAMLRYSVGWGRRGARLVVNSAEQLPVSDGTFDFLVSSLGDPYNASEFWREVSRVLRSGGLAVFTTPSYRWATAFRAGRSWGDAMAAEFELSDGRSVLVPSWIYPEDQQLELIERHGLSVQDVVRVPRSALSSARVSPKLLIGDDLEMSVVTGYLVKGNRK